MARLFQNANYDFIASRGKAYVFSSIVAAAGIAAAVFFLSSRGSALHYGVDFTGGTIVQVVVPQAKDAGDLRSAVNSAVPGAEITNFGGEGSEFLIRTPVGEAGAAESAEAVVAALRAQFGADGVTVARTEAVGAKVGNELQGRAVLAILISFGATLLYLAFRFEWRFGLAAVLATMHDIALTIAFIALLRLEISLTMVAAVLTIVGYSLNDTIIIFDRIRENLRTARRSEFVATINRSINETLPRTVMTVGTTLATLLSLFLFGGDVVREFALIMIIGIILGTYSSIFIASPALLAIEKKWPGETAPRTRRTATTRGPRAARA